MGCCGKGITKIGHILKGTAKALAGDSIELSNRRLLVCEQCPEKTWLNAQEYIQWLLSHGIEVIRHFTELEKLPKLPKQNRDKSHRHPFCRVCKCSLRAKTFVEEEACPLGKWSEANNLLKNADTG
jgi:hypothetical protein